MAKIVLGKESETKLASVALSNNTEQRRIGELSEALKTQVVDEIKSAAFGLFSFQLNESTNVASCSQLLVFARYVHTDVLKEFLFCTSLQTTTKAADVLRAVEVFFEAGNLD
ncbi:protein FAM200C-like [Watersipora subatra]|uniref:protein FAM200C-like n=1 Tax=Watersipora subatra TaxID=2589382 RepID=UPI00355BF5BE